MTDIGSLRQQLEDEGHLDTLAKDAAIAFGTKTEQLVGQQLMPERLTDSNEFSEIDIRFEGSPANDATRYSEPQMKRGGSVAVAEGRYGEIDIAAQLTGRDFDDIRKAAANNPERAKAQLISWHNQNLNLALVKKQEIQRWQVMLNARLEILGTDGKVSFLNFNDPEGHRITVPSGTRATPAGWYGSTIDPVDALLAGKSAINSKGYEVSRVIGDSRITNVLANNPIIQGRLGTVTIADGALTTRRTVGSLSSVAGLLATFGLPYEEYNASYRTQIGSGFYKEPGTILMVATTGRNAEVFTASETIILENVLGYYGIGLAVGENNPGRVIRSVSSNMKPVGIYGQGFQASAPVLLASEAIAVIRIPEPVAA